MAEWLTISEIAEKAKVPETSVRRYIKTFKEYFPGKQIGRGWKYIPDVVKIIDQISAGYQAGHSTQEIFTILRLNFAQVVEVEEENHHITTTQPPQPSTADLATIQTEALKQIAVILNKFITHERKLETFSNYILTLSDEVVFLRKKFEGEKNKTKDKADLEEKDKELAKTRLALSKANEVLTELVRYKQDLEQQTKDLRDQQAENERLQAEIEKLKRPWWKRVFKK